MIVRSKVDNNIIWYGGNNLLICIVVIIPDRGEIRVTALSLSVPSYVANSDLRIFTSKHGRNIGRPSFGVINVGVIFPGLTATIVCLKDRIPIKYAVLAS